MTIRRNRQNRDTWSRYTIVYISDDTIFGRVMFPFCSLGGVFAMQDYIAGLPDCDTPKSLWAYCLQVVRKIGFEAAVYAVPPPNKKPTHPDTIIRIHGMSPADFHRFALQGLIAEGHLTTANSLFKAAPFRWSDIASLTSDTQNFYDLQEKAHEVGLTDGWVIPVFGPKGRTGLASYGMPRHLDLMEERTKHALQHFAQLAHLRLCQITPYMYELNKNLSKRETQIISWVAKGKSNSEIAQILKVSEASIDSYLRRAFAKLGVHDRTSAAVKAISHDIVRI